MEVLSKPNPEIPLLVFDYQDLPFSYSNRLPKSVRRQLAVIYEHEGCIDLVWHYGPIPMGFEQGDQIELNVHGDWDLWTVNTSKTPIVVNCG